MRCFLCGDEKVLAEAMPAEDMAVPGFEYQILQCPGCNDTERRLLFTGGVTVFARRAMKVAASASQPRRKVEAPDSSNAANPEIISEVSTASREEKWSRRGEKATESTSELTVPVSPATDLPVITQEPNPTAASDVSGQAWLRAVEKLRSYQTALHLRAKEANKTNGSPIIASVRGSPSPASVQDCDEGAVRFNELWNGLAPPQSPRQTESSRSPAALAVLPISLGMKLLEEVEAAGLSG